MSRLVHLAAVRDRGDARETRAEREGDDEDEEDGIPQTPGRRGRGLLRPAVREEAPDDVGAPAREPENEGEAAELRLATAACREESGRNEREQESRGEELQSVGPHARDP